MCVSSSFACLVGQVLHEFKSPESKTTCLRRADEWQFLILIYLFHLKQMDQKVILFLHNIFHEALSSNQNFNVKISNHSYQFRVTKYDITIYVL